MASRVVPSHERSYGRFTCRTLYIRIVRNRFHLPGVLAPGQSVDLAGTEFHHAVRVARIRIGEVIEIFDGDGRAAAATVRTLDQDRAGLVVTDEMVPSREAPFRIELALSLIQLERFEIALQKATELGAYRIIPLLAERCEIRQERTRGKRDRWKKIIFEAVKQSGRSRIPELAEPQTFDSVLSSGGVNILLDAGARPSRLPERTDTATLLIGPEGGWSDDELLIARERGAHFRRLGPRRLRAETAAIAAMTAIGIELGDLRETASPDPST